MTDAEIPLKGGNMNTGVVRIGDTVRRPAGPWTPAVHALLDHLHGVGFPGAPRPLGLDEHGREILTFVPGTVAWPEPDEEIELTVIDHAYWYSIPLIGSYGERATARRRHPAVARRDRRP
jgi:hypothetical protein